MASLNKVLLIGNLTRNPDVRYLPSGTALAELRMAVNRRYRTQTGEDREDTCFVQVTVFGKQAETVGKYLQKGSPALIEGRLKYDEWEKDNQRHSRLSVVAERVQFMGGPRREGEYGDSPGGAPPPRRAAPSAPPAAAGEGEGEDAPSRGDEGDDEDLPF